MKHLMGDYVCNVCMLFRTLSKAHLIFQHLKKKQLLKENTLVIPNEVTETDLRMVHSASYLRSLKVSYCHYYYYPHHLCFKVIDFHAAHTLLYCYSLSRWPSPYQVPFPTSIQTDAQYLQLFSHCCMLVLFLFYLTLMLFRFLASLLSYQFLSWFFLLFYYFTPSLSHSHFKVWC